MHQRRSIRLPKAPTENPRRATKEHEGIDFVRISSWPFVDHNEYLLVFYEPSW